MGFFFYKKFGKNTLFRYTRNVIKNYAIIYRNRRFA